MRQILLTASLLALAACASRHTQTIVLHEDGLLNITGTFSSVTVEEGKGVYGAEVRIVVTDDPPHQATVQFGKCSLAKSEALGSQDCFAVSNLILVQPRFTSPDQPPGELVEFTLPAESGYAGSFRGLLTDAALKGTFRFASGQTLDATMHRVPSGRERPE